jgi:hypothetical protein
MPNLNLEMNMNIDEVERNLEEELENGLFPIINDDISSQHVAWNDQGFNIDDDEGILLRFYCFVLFRFWLFSFFCCSFI